MKIEVSASSSETLLPFNSLALSQRATDADRRSQVGIGCELVHPSIGSKDEQTKDRLSSIIVDALCSLFKMGCLDQLATVVVEQFEALLLDHHLSPSNSRIRMLVPEIKPFFTPLPFSEAFAIYNQKYRITKRSFIPPSFHEIRHIMNIAQVMAVKSNLRLVTLDGDETLYPDRRNFQDVLSAHYLTTLLQDGVAVAVVTAAGYGYQTEKYESRLHGLLEFWKRKRLRAEVLKKFFLFGGESNYLLRCGADYRLHAVPETEWRLHLSEKMKTLFQESEKPGGEINRLLSIAAHELEQCCEDLSLRSMVIRKERAVGLVPGGAEGRKKKPTGSGTSSLKPEILDEAFYRVHQAIRSAVSCSFRPLLASAVLRVQWRPRRVGGRRQQGRGRARAAEFSGDCACPVFTYRGPVHNKRK